MNNTLNVGGVFSGIFALVLITIGVLNLVLVHPVPGIVYLLLSSLYIPPVNDLIRKRFGFSIPPVVKLILGILVIWFTLGVSDLAEMYGL